MTTQSLFWPSPSPPKSPRPRAERLLPVPCLLLSCLLLNGCPPTHHSLTIPELQGADHRSPVEGKNVEVGGVVTAVDASEEGGGFWVQDPAGDGDLATSDGVFVESAGLRERPEVGDRVLVRGRVLESGREGDLTVTSVAAEGMTIEASGQVLPEPVVLGAAGRRPPNRLIDDDGLSSFDPEKDGIDFYESLEGMRVVVQEAVVVGPTTRHGEWVVVGDAGADASVRTPRGGLALRPEDPNPERILMASRLLPAAPSVTVGSAFAGSISGVLDYTFGNFKVQPSELPEIAAAGPPMEETSLRPEDGLLTVASFNILNLSAVSEPERITRVAEVIATDMAGPDLIGLQEVQDANGPEDDGTVDAGPTLDALAAAIREAGGPAYEHCQIDPLDGADGGQPGGNIRVAFLYNPLRVEFSGRPESGAGLRVETRAGRPRLAANPGRIEPEHPAFERSRKTLAAEFGFAGEAVFLAVAHFRSKGGDDGLMGAHQPPEQHSEEQRMGQAESLRRFMDRMTELDPRAHLVVLGDLNEHEFRAPVQHLLAPGWRNLIEDIPREDRYTFNYQGNSQVLDHIIVSPALAERSPEVDIVHVNADFNHDGRSSDHDPIVARFDFRGGTHSGS